MLIVPSSSGWRSASSAGRWNSGSSSSRRTPRCARLASPGRGPLPPPTIAAIDALWCGARNGGTRISGRPGGSTPATEWIRVTSSASLVREQRQDPGQPAGEHRLAGARRPREQQVVPARGRELERAPGALLTADVDEVGRRQVADVAVPARRLGAASRLAAQVGDRLGEMPHRNRLDAGQRHLGARLGRADRARRGRRGARPRRRRARRRPAAAGRRAPARRRPRGRRGAGRELPRRREHRERDREVEAGALLAQAGGREVDGDPPRRARSARPTRSRCGRAASPPGRRGRRGRRSRTPGRRARGAPRPRRGAARGRRAHA